MAKADIANQGGCFAKSLWTQESFQTKSEVKMNDISSIFQKWTFNHGTSRASSVEFASLVLHCYCPIYF